MKNLSKEKIEGLLDFSADVYVFDEVESTNDVAKDIGEGIVFAERQSLGRGRKGRSFFSGEGGLYLSIAMRAEGAEVAFNGTHVPFSPGRITIAAGIAVAKTLASYGYDARIKWVNDVYVSGKKVCGILAERSGDTVVLGIGVNLRSNIPPELEFKAASLGLNADICEVGAKILNRFAAELVSPDTEYLRSHCLTIGKTVVTEFGVGRATDICEDGALCVETNGVNRRVYSGEAEINE